MTTTNTNTIQPTTTLSQHRGDKPTNREGKGPWRQKQNTPCCFTSCLSAACLQYFFFGRPVTVVVFTPCTCTPSWCPRVLPNTYTCTTVVYDWRVRPERGCYEYRLMTGLLLPRISTAAGSSLDKVSSQKVYSFLGNEGLSFGKGKEMNTQLASAETLRMISPSRM